MLRAKGLLTATTVVALTGFAVGAPVWAQGAADQVWIQVEARNAESAALERLDQWSQNFNGIAGFRLPSGWYAVAVGPFTADEARARLSEWRAAGLIPADSYIPDPRLMQNQIWPRSDAGFGAPVQSIEVSPETPPAENSGTQSPGTETAGAETAGAETAALAPAALSETPAQARAYEAGLSREERMNIQRALQWAGVYNSGIDGAFGPGTRGSISEWQLQNGYEATGVAGATQTAALVGGWQAEVKALGMALTRDEEAGIELDLPLGLIGFDRYAPPFALYGPRNDSGMELRLISLPGDQAALEGLYNSLLADPALPASGARMLRPDGFNFEGRSADTEIAGQAVLSRGVIRGFVLRARAADASRNARVLQALKSSFKPLGQQVLDPGIEPIDAGLKANIQAGTEIRPPRAAFSGFFIDAAGLVLTAAAPLAQCRQPVLDGGQPASVVWKDDALGVAVLKPAVALAPKAVAQLAGSLPVQGAEVALAGFSFGAALALPSVTFGHFGEAAGLDGAANRARLSLAAMAGDAGGPVLGPDGLVIGALLPASQGGARSLPEGVTFVAPAPQIVAALNAAGMRLTPPQASGQPLVAEDLSARGADMAVQVICRD